MRNIRISFFFHLYSYLNSHYDARRRNAIYWKEKLVILFPHLCHRKRYCMRINPCRRFKRRRNNYRHKIVPNYLRWFSGINGQRPIISKLHFLGFSWTQNWFHNLVSLGISSSRSSNKSKRLTLVTIDKDSHAIIIRHTLICFASFFTWRKNIITEAIVVNMLLLN